MLGIIALLAVLAYLGFRHITESGKSFREVLGFCKHDWSKEDENEARIILRCRNCGTYKNHKL